MLIYNVVILSVVPQNDSGVDIHSCSDSFPTWILTEYWVEVPVLYNRSPLADLSIHNSVICQSKPQSIPLPVPFPFGNHKFVFQVCESDSILQISSFVSFLLISHTSDII